MDDKPFVGRTPVKSEVVEHRRPGPPPKIEFTVTEYVGTAISLRSAPGEPVTWRNLLMVGTPIIACGLFGEALPAVVDDVMDGGALSFRTEPDGRLGGFLKFGEDDRKCWVQTLLYSRDALARVEFTA